VSDFSKKLMGSRTVGFSYDPFSVLGKFGKIRKNKEKLEKIRKRRKRKNKKK
jgi:hypothetical protein